MSTFTHLLQHIFAKDPSDALEDHEGTVSIRDFADDFDGLAGEEDLANLV